MEKIYITINYNASLVVGMALKAKVRRIGTSMGIIIPKEKLEELRVREGDTIIIPRIEKTVKEIRGILKGTKFVFARESIDRDKDIDEAFVHARRKSRRTR